MVTRNADYLRSPCAITIHRLVAFQESDILSSQLFQIWHCLRYRVCTLCRLTHGSFPLHVFCPQLLCQLLQECPPDYSAAGALREQDVGIDPSQVKDVIEDRQWPSSCNAFDRICPCHLVQDILVVLGVVVVHHTLWFCLHRVKVLTPVCTELRIQTFFLCFPWCTVRVASPHFNAFVLNSSACCFTEGGTPAEKSSRIPLEKNH